MTNFEFTFEGLTADTMKGWERRLQETFIAPPEQQPEDELSEVQEIKASPRANIVVSRVPGTGKPTESCQLFIAQTKPAVPGLVVVEEERELKFNDEARGVTITVEFPATETIRLRQLHAFRSEEGVETQIVATFAKWQEGEYQSKLLDIIRSFKPGAEPKSTSELAMVEGRH